MRGKRSLRPIAGFGRKPSADVLGHGSGGDAMAERVPVAAARDAADETVHAESGRFGVPQERRNERKVVDAVSSRDRDELPFRRVEGTHAQSLGEGPTHRRVGMDLDARADRDEHEPCPRMFDLVSKPLQDPLRDAPGALPRFGGSIEENRMIEAGFETGDAGCDRSSSFFFSAALALFALTTRTQGRGH